MDLQPLKELLKEECHYQLREEVMDEFLSFGTLVELDRGEPIISPGEVNPHIYIVMDGIMRRWFWNSDKEVTISFALAGTLFFSNHSYYMDQESVFGFDACTPVKLLKIKREHYNGLIASNHEFCQWALSMAKCQLWYYDMKDNVFQGTARERYDALLKNRPDILQQVSLGIIASYLRITPQYLSKLRNEE